MKEQPGMDKGPFTIYHNDTPLTVPIHDKNRLALAYNMLYSMAENGAAVAVKENITVMDSAHLYAKDNEGSTFIPAHDPEWSDIREPGMGIQAYSICSYDRHDKVAFVPSTWDKDKAAEMFQFMCHGLNPSVSLFYDEYGDFDEYGDEDEIDAYMTKIDTDTVNLISLEGAGANSFCADCFCRMHVIKAPEHEPDWAKNAMDEELKNRIYSFETPQLDESLLKEPEDNSMENGFEM